MYVFNPFTGNFDAVTDPFAEPLVFTANCDASDQVHHCVYISADAVSGVPQVTRVDTSDPTKMPAIGIVLSKSSPTDCVVAYFGCVTLSALVPNKRYFVGATSFLAPSVPPARPFMLQVIGQAVDSTRLLVAPAKDMVRLI